MVYSLSENLLQNFEAVRYKKVPRGAFTFKIIIVGNPGVGKTSLVYRFTEGRLPAEYKPTLGVNILTKVMHIRRDTEVKWIIWDVGSQRRMEHLRQIFYKGAAAILLVFDQTNPASLEALETTWLKELVDAKVNVTKIPVIVVANKTDYITRDVTVADATRALIDRNKVHFIETSALTGTNVEVLFEYLAFQCLPNCSETSNF